MELVKIDYVENGTSIAEEKELRNFFFGCCAAFRTIQAYFLNISLLPRAAVYVSSTTTPKAET
jgi:hypothetical protein